MVHTGHRITKVKAQGTVRKAQESVDDMDPLFSTALAPPTDDDGSALVHEVKKGLADRMCEQPFTGQVTEPEPECLCQDHPEYGAMRRPNNGCATCLEAWKRLFRQ